MSLRLLYLIFRQVLGLVLLMGPHIRRQGSRVVNNLWRVYGREQLLLDPGGATEGMTNMADTHRLPAPVTDVWDWQMRGACRDMDSALFFHPENERGPARAGREARAKQVCRSCPVLVQCGAHALAAHEPYGVWGGMSESERDAIVRAQDRILRVLNHRRTTMRSS